MVVFVPYTTKTNEIYTNTSLKKLLHITRTKNNFSIKIYKETSVIFQCDKYDITEKFQKSLNYVSTDSI